MAAPFLPPLPDAADKSVVPETGKSTLDQYLFLRRVEDILRRDHGALTDLVVGSPTGGNKGSGTINAEAIYEQDKRALTEGGGRTLSGGFVFAEYDLGTVSSGTITPNPSNGLKQKLTNNGAFTLAATSEIGDLELRVTNGASAGSITFSGFEKNWPGDALNTTNGNQFVIFIYGFDGRQAYTIKALQ